MNELSRRAVFGAGASALGAGTFGNLADIAAARAVEPDDPIFDLIEKHRAMYDAVEAQDNINDDELTEACNTIHAVREAILSGPFATLAGAAAALRFLHKYELKPNGYGDHSSDFLARLANAMERRGAAQ